MSGLAGNSICLAPSAGTASNMKKYTLLGNNLIMEMAENPYKLKIIGDNNYIKIHKNFGHVIMRGNNCGIDVPENKGVVQMIECSVAIRNNCESECKVACEENKVQKNRKKKSFKSWLYKLVRSKVTKLKPQLKI